MAVYLSCQLMVCAAFRNILSDWFLRLPACQNQTRRAFLFFFFPSCSYLKSFYIVFCFYLTLEIYFWCDSIRLPWPHSRSVCWNKNYITKTILTVLVTLVLIKHCCSHAHRTGRTQNLFTLFFSFAK